MPSTSPSARDACRGRRAVRGAEACRIRGIGKPGQDLPAWFKPPLDRSVLYLRKFCTMDESRTLTHFGQGHRKALLSGKIMCPQ